MRFIEVHEFDTGEVVLINVNKIDIIYHMDDRRDNLCSSSYGCKAALLTLYILAAGLITLFFDYIWSI
jgi:hypothetical protein